MGIPEIVNKIIDYVPSIDWSVSYDDEQVSLFETTIRYLGGLLSGYGTLVLEWTHLSDLTGDDTYGGLAQKGESYLLNPQPVSYVNRNLSNKICSDTI